MSQGGIYSVGYNAWTGHDGLDRMFDALESEGVSMLVDTRNSDYQARYSYDQLAQAAAQRTGVTARRMLFASRPALAGKPREEAEYNAEGQADYRAMNQRPDAKQILDGMAQAAQKGERIALLCACAETCTCHRTRWLSRALARRGFDVAHIEPGEYDADRDREEGRRELYRITRQSDLPELPTHSEVNWRERGEQWHKSQEPTPIPHNYRSPQPVKPIPAEPKAVLIAGSMKANPAQLNYASALVVRAAEIGAQIHVGDNAQGVDARVVETAAAIGYDNVVVWTAGDDPRNGGVPGGQVRKVPYNYQAAGNGFTQRDRTMIRSLDPHHGAAFFINNGRTHYQNGRQTGTEAGYVFAIEQGKAAKKLDFNRFQDRNALLQPLPTRYTPRTIPEQAPPASVSDAVKTDPEGSLPSKRHPTLQDLEAELRQRQAAAIPPPASDLVILPDAVPADQERRWAIAREAAAFQASKRRNELESPVPAVLDLQTLPLTDEQGQALGYAVAGIDVRWQPAPFRIKTDNWLKAHTIRVMDVAHFQEAEAAQTYQAQLAEYMEKHQLQRDVRQGYDFLHGVSQLNGLHPQAHTTQLLDQGTVLVTDLKAEMQALRAGELPRKTWATDFQPLDQPALIAAEPMHSYSIHAMQQPAIDGQPPRFAVVARRDVHRLHATDPEESYVMELSHLPDASAAHQYAAHLDDFMRHKPEIAMQGSAEQTAVTQRFLCETARDNGLSAVEQVCDQDDWRSRRLTLPDAPMVTTPEMDWER